MPYRRLVVSMQDKTKLNHCKNCPHTHIHVISKTFASNVESIAIVLCNWGAAPVATTSNGEPPPESEFESWLLAPLELGALLGAVTEVGAVSVGSPPKGVDVAVVSMFRPLEEIVLESLVVLVEDSVVVAVAEVLVLDCKVVRVVGDDLKEVLEASSLLGHNAAMPMSFWKTPMIDVSPTSTSAQLVLIAAAIFASPAKQLELQVAPRLKSEEVQASILVL